MKINTKLTKVSRNVKKQKGFINPGIYKGSTMIFNTFEEYINDLKIHDDHNTLYAINNNPSVDQLDTDISTLYKCHDTIVTSSGISTRALLTYSMSSLNSLTRTSLFSLIKAEYFVF